MKNKTILTTLALFGLMVTGCTGPSSVPASSSQTPEPSSSAAPSSTSSSASSSQAEETELYYSKPFGYEDKWEKGHEYTWTFEVKEDHAEMTFAFGAQMSSDSHSDRSLFTNHNGASSSDAFESNEANDGTPRLSLKVNGEEMCLTRDTYGEAGLDTSDINYYRISKFGVRAGTLNISLTTHASAGYRLIVGGDARLYYPKTEPTTPEGYKITFASTNCKVYVFDSQDTTGTGIEYTAPVQSRDSAGVVSKYIVPTTEGEDDIKPQVNFKVVCNNGYKVTDDCFAISGSKGQEWNNIKAQGNGVYRITKIKADITVTITPVVDAGGETIDAAKVTFTLTNCTVKVYVGPKAEDGSNVDAGPDFYSRNKAEPYAYEKGDNAQFNFEVVPNAGFKFVDGVTFDDAGEAKANAVSFISGSYNKLKKIDTNLYRLTKVTGDIAITVACVAE